MERRSGPLQSAMNSSVNWYFQAVDEQLGASDVYSYVQEIGYGNENMSGDFSSYWMESSLEISPIEQVELLTKLQNNSFGFAPENINAVKMPSAFQLPMPEHSTERPELLCEWTGCKRMVHRLYRNCR